MQQEYLTPEEEFQRWKERRARRRIIFILVGAIGGPLLMIGLLIFWVIPSMIHAQQDRAIDNLKQIGRALHTYHDAFNHFPPAHIQEQGRPPTYSWRVAILPYLGEDELYDQYDSNKPWDHPDNLLLVDQMPQVYASPYFWTRDSSGKTPYVVIAGPDTVLSASHRRRRFADIRKGTSHTALVIESQQDPVVWTQPDDAAPEWIVENFDRLANNPNGGVLVLMADGSVRFAAADLPPEEFEKTFHLSDTHWLKLPVIRE